MKRQALIVIIAALLAWATPALSAEKDFKCNECHTKNPKLYRMHEALGFKDCMLCHDPAKFKFGQSLGVNTPTPEQARRMASEPICLRCHKSP